MFPIRLSLLPSFIKNPSSIRSATGSDCAMSWCCCVTNNPPRFQSFTMILPVFNEEARVKRVVDYYRPFAKLIVVDNYSTDGTLPILQELGVEVIRHRNEGSLQSPEGLRFMLSLSSTPYVLFLSCTEF